MKNYNMVEVTYLGATNTRGSRVKLESHRLQEKIIIPYDYQYNNIIEMGVAYLKEKGLPIIGVVETKKGYGIILGAKNNQFNSIK